MGFEVSYTGKTPQQMKKEYDAFIRKLPELIGREAVNFFKDRFRFGNWIDESPVKWPARKVEDKGAKRGLLVKTGKLRNSIRVIETGANYVVIGSDMPYAKAHNEGLNAPVNIAAHTRKNNQKVKATFSSLKTKKKSSRTINVTVGKVSVKAHVRNMKIPQRQFMGMSAFLIRRIQMVVEYELKQIFNG
ncbi:hypothetical protein BH09BAC1_BH09BAC1_14220 [soil metagenome]